MAAKTYSDLGNIAQILELKITLKTKKIMNLWAYDRSWTYSERWVGAGSADEAKYKEILDKEWIFDFRYRMNKELDEGATFWDSILS